jgi:hypothetical protein
MTGMDSFGPLFHSSGGLLYHLRAWRHGDRLWTDFRAQVAAWLRAWQPRTETLILVGPSAGYTLPPDFLAAFHRIIALEPEPLARWLLRRRFPDARIEFGPALRHPAELADHTDGAVLFCNLLGQDWTDLPAETWRPELARALAGRSWASYHDLATTTRPPDHHATVELARAQPLDAILARFWRSGVLEIEDHERQGLFPDLPRAYTIWHLRPGSHHLVEWLRG